MQRVKFWMVKIRPRKLLSCTKLLKRLKEMKKLQVLWNVVASFVNSTYITQFFEILFDSFKRTCGLTRNSFSWVGADRALWLAELHAICKYTQNNEYLILTIGHFQSMTTVIIYLWLLNLSINVKFAFGLMKVDIFDWTD